MYETSIYWQLRKINIISCRTLAELFYQKSSIMGKGFMTVHRRNQLTELVRRNSRLQVVCRPSHRARGKHVRCLEPTRVWPGIQENSHSVSITWSSLEQTTAPFLGALGAGQVFTVNQYIHVMKTFKNTYQKLNKVTHSYSVPRGNTTASFKLLGNHVKFYSNDTRLKSDNAL